MSKNYAGVEDLLSDESFLSWYFKTDIPAIHKWEQWISGNPGSRDRVDQAVEFLQSLRLSEPQSTPEQITRAERLLLEKIRDAERRMPVAPVRRFSTRRRWLVAASVILLAAGLYGGYRVITAQSELHTAYGEVKENRLPDGTEVSVNADTRIVYSSGWKDGKDREVWLTGEAFFHVRKTPLKSRFIVHTNHFDIIVTGTQFNVVSRQDETNVMLKEGSVILHTTEGKEFRMKPGDFVEYNRAELEKRPVRTDSVVAWKDHKLIFDNTSLQEVAWIIHEHYGVTVEFAGDNVASKTVSGILANDNLDGLLKVLDATSDFRITREGDKVIIR
ncbi:MAG TPA: FecR domain-containing protein [Puia sp.]|jgi:ferric-dicitrate binding protein FerR (iron transport regulator)